MRQWNNETMKQGFTILEVLIAIFLLTVGIGAISALVWQFTAFASISSSRLTAMYLAQEGLELVRNLRDSNWLQERLTSELPWDEGLTEGVWEIDYNDTGLTTYLGSGRFLRFGAGFYNYDAGVETKFKRKITFAKATDIIAVSVEVTWQERGREHWVKAEGYLYNSIAL